MSFTVVFGALQFDGENYAECKDWIGEENIDNTLNYPNIKTSEGTIAVVIGDWIIRENGRPYLCKPDVFEKTYFVRENQLIRDDSK